MAACDFCTPFPQQQETSPSPSNSSCFRCNSHPAAYLCLCSYPCRPICLQCSGVHSGENDCLAPLEMRNTLGTQEKVRECRERREVVERMIGMLRENEEEVEVCIQYFQQFVANIQEKVHNWSETTLSNLHTVQSTLHSHISTLTSHLSSLRFQSSFDLNTELDHLVASTKLDQIDQSKDRLKLITFQFKPYVLTTALEEIFRYEEDYSVMRPTTRLAFFAGDTRRCIDYNLLDKMKKTREMASYEHKNGAGWCLVPTINQFLYTGGLTNSYVSSETYVLNSLSTAVNRRENMHQARFSHSIVYVNGGVYVFGGCRIAPSTPRKKGGNKVEVEGDNGVLGGSERYDLERDRWVSVGDMLEPRYGATASHYDGKVYIVGGMGSKHGEMYSPQDNSFTFLPLELPSNDKFTTVVSTQNTLFILHDRSLYEYSLSTGSFEVRGELPETGNWYSPLQPLVYEGQCYFLRSSYEAWKVNTDTGDIRLVFTLF